jgi:hypothetical protein
MLCCKFVLQSCRTIVHFVFGGVFLHIFRRIYAPYVLCITLVPGLHSFRTSIVSCQWRGSHFTSTGKFEKQNRHRVPRHNSRFQTWTWLLTEQLPLLAFCHHPKFFPLLIRVWFQRNTATKLQGQNDSKQVIIVCEKNGLKDSLSNLYSLSFWFVSSSHKRQSCQKA